MTAQGFRSGRVAFVWARSRRAPQLVVLAGSVVAIAGLTGLVPVEAEFVDVAVFGGSAPWWVPVDR